MLWKSRTDAKNIWKLMICINSLAFWVSLLKWIDETSNFCGLLSQMTTFRKATSSCGDVFTESWSLDASGKSNEVSKRQFISFAYQPWRRPLYKRLWLSIYKDWEEADRIAISFDYYFWTFDVAFIMRTFKYADALCERPSPYGNRIFH